jgi:hypothetical protein
MKIKSLNIMANFPYFSVYIFLIPLAVGITSFFAVAPANKDDDLPFTDCIFKNNQAGIFVEQTYYWGRLLSIVFNFLAFIYVTAKVEKMGFTSFLRESRSNISKGSSDNGNRELTVTERQALAVKTLASRLKYYPLAQALCRFGAAWDEFDNYSYSNNTTTILAAILSPLSGIFYFLIFLVSLAGICQHVYCR